MASVSHSAKLGNWNHANVPRMTTLVKFAVRMAVLVNRLETIKLVVPYISIYLLAGLAKEKMCRVFVLRYCDFQIFLDSQSA